MATEKPIREMDTILIRVPDGMKSLIAERAKANGRSMSSEVVYILENEFDLQSNTRIRELSEIIQSLESERNLLAVKTAEIHARLESASAELENWKNNKSKKAAKMARELDQERLHRFERAHGLDSNLPEE